MDQQPEQDRIEVDPEGIIKHQGNITGHLVIQLTSDLAITRALLDVARSEVERLTRVNDELRSATSSDSK